VDREYTDAGGVGEKLLETTNADPDPAKTSTRNIYTYFRESINLIDPSNAFTLSNDVRITPELLGLLPGDTVGREALIKFTHGLDAYYENEIYPKGPDNKKDWVLGSFIHSRPVVVHYGGRSVIYTGANDGMVHAFDDLTGVELWSFILPNMLPVKTLEGGY
jgi:type IV pilus assembly protein PilY1